MIDLETGRWKEAVCLVAGLLLTIIGLTLIETHIVIAAFLAFPGIGLVFSCLLLQEKRHERYFNQFR